MSVKGARIQWLSALAVVLLTAALFYPSLNSSFLLDDYVNLNRLDEVGSKGYGYFIFSGISGPSGRPLSLATFALQHQAWPDNPFAFKFVNLLIHLINGLLIFAITRTLLRKLPLDKQAVHWISLIALAVAASSYPDFHRAVYRAAHDATLNPRDTGGDRRLSLFP